MRTVNPKGSCNYILGAALRYASNGQRHRRMVYGQGQEDKAAQSSRSLARFPDHCHPAKFIDFTMAPDAETAEEQVAEAYDIGDELRHRLMAIRDDL